MMMIIKPGLHYMHCINEHKCSYKLTILPTHGYRSLLKWVISEALYWEQLWAQSAIQVMKRNISWGHFAILFMKDVTAGWMHLSLRSSSEIPAPAGNLDHLSELVYLKDRSWLSTSKMSFELGWNNEYIFDSGSANLIVFELRLYHNGICTSFTSYTIPQPLTLT